MSRAPLSTCFTLFLSLLAVHFPAFAQTGSRPEVSEQALAAIAKSIADVQAEIGRRTGERSSVYTALQSAEQSLTAISSDIATLESSIRDNETRLAQLEQEGRRLHVRKLQQQALIGQYLRSAYRTGRQEYLKLLLNQEDPAAISRTLNYYRYFSDARSGRIREYSNTLDELGRVEASTRETSGALQGQRQSLDEQRDAMQQGVRERQALLDELDVELSNSSARLAALQSERQSMQLLIEELRRAITNLSLGNQQQAFAGMKGKLPWPVEGNLKNRWGSSYGNGDLNWQGVTIAAAAGQDVHAIHHGRVVFSDWFASSGLLLIIDHGDGYMSLYAHNQALYKDVGEWVNAGETIASVGNTGGQQEFGLYFEIRQNGESVNPATWCLARN